jgi:hypothetical protein
VAFYSYATNLVAGDTNGVPDVFVHDLQTGETARVSVASNGTQGNGSSDGGDQPPAISGNGRYVAFQSAATNLVTPDANGVTREIYVRDLWTGQTTRVSVATSGTQGDGQSLTPALSANGRYVAFWSEATNLVAGDFNGVGDVFAAGPLWNAMSDFNADGRSDIVWRNYATGQDAVWTMSGATVLGALSLPTVTDTTWQIVGVGDFDGNGWPDLVWRNAGTGQSALWFMNGATIIGGASLPSPDTTWQIAGAADFNADGHPELLWHNSATGLNVLWYMNGATIIGSALPPSVSDLTWQIAGVADFNADGQPDLLWHNTSTGMNFLWYMNGAAIIGSALAPAVADTTWHIVGIGDFNGDGHPDLLWHNTASGQRALWFMDGATIIGGASLPTLADANWAILYPR